MKIVITGAAGLVGQNLVPRLKRRGGFQIVGIDKHPANTRILRRLHPDITVIEADLAEDDGWRTALDGADALVIGHAQIGGLDRAEFTRNNVTGHASGCSPRRTGAAAATSCISAPRS